MVSRTAPLRRRVLFLCLPLAAPTIASAEEPDDAPPPHTLITDRPDFTESAETVPAGRIQIETGFTFTYDNGGDTKEWELPETLLRIGFADRAELRITLPSYASLDETGGASTTGATDSSLGFKVKLFDQREWVPSFAVLGEMSIPTGTSSFTSDDVEPKGILAFAYDLPADFSLGINLGVASLVDGDDRFFESSASIALGIPIGDRFGGFVEYFGFYRAGGGGGPEHTIDTGFTFLLTPTIQLDAFIGFGLNDAADDLFTGAGISILF